MLATAAGGAGLGLLCHDIYSCPGQCDPIPQSKSAWTVICGVISPAVGHLLGQRRYGSATIDPTPITRGETLTVAVEASSR